MAVACPSRTTAGPAGPPASRIPHSASLLLPLPPQWLRIVGGTALAMALTVAPLTAADLSRYREYALGSSLEDVLQVSRARPLDVVTVHDGPNRIQTLGPTTPTAAPLQSVALEARARTAIATAVARHTAEEPARLRKAKAAAAATS